MKKILLLLIAVILPLFLMAQNANDPSFNEKEKDEANSLVSSTTQLVKDLKQSDLGKVSDIFVSITTLIICIGAICVISTKTIKALMKGEAIDLFTILLPFLFAIIISSYQPICKGIDWSIESFEGLTARLSQNTLVKIENARQEKEKLINEIERKQKEVGIEDDRSWWRKLGDIFVSAINGLRSFFINYPIQLIAYCAAFITKLLAAAIGIILYVIGPIMIALSVIPAFSDNWKNWLAKYIWVSLWLPLCHIISWILKEVELSILNKDISRLQYCLNHFEETGGGVDLINSGFAEGTAYLGFMICGAILYITIPSISSWFVNTSGGGIITAMNASGAYMMAKSSKAGKKGIEKGYGVVKEGSRKGYEKIRGLVK